MIALFTGSVGSGKSYHALVYGLQKISAIPDRYVVANFPIKFRKGKKGEKERKRWHFWREITPERLIAFSLEKGFYGKEGHCLLIIDEAGVIFNSRDWQIKGVERTKWIKFMSQSRKFGYDIILVAQSDRMIDRQIRDLAEYEVRHYSARRYWWLRWFPLKLHFAVWFWYHTRLRGTLDAFVIWKKVADRYDSMRIFNLEDMEKSIEDIYKGKVIPAEVAKFLEFIRAERDKEKFLQRIESEGDAMRRA
ncbi:MAG: zonular occludens toxin domain-containing protein [Moorellaceae bacterium]